jgi:hypothetical protein
MGLLEELLMYVERIGGSIIYSKCSKNVSIFFFLVASTDSDVFTQVSFYFNKEHWRLSEVEQFLAHSRPSIEMLN